MITYQTGTTRLIRRFVIRKRIGDEVRSLQICCWEEEYQEKAGADGLWKEFVPTKFVSEQNFNQKAGQFRTC